jgi:ABC-2 type transport system permease protein
MAGVGALGYVLGMMVAPIMLFLFQALIMTPLAIWLGAETTLLGWVSTVLLAALCIGFWTGAAIVVTTIVRNYEQRDLIINLSMLPLTFSAPVFYPLNQAPKYLEVAARFNPLSYQVDAMRDAFLGDVNALALLIALALSIGSIAAAAIVVARGEPLGSEQ